MRLIEASLLLSVAVAAPTHAAAARDPSIRVGVKIPRNDPNKMLEFVPQLRKILEKAKADAAMRLETPEAPADLALVLVERSTATRSGGEGPTIFMFKGFLAGRAMPQAQTLLGGGPSWDDALQNFADNASLMVAFNATPVLRARTDWPDTSFEFRALSVDDRKSRKIKDGVALVISVALEGAAATAGLHVADVITRLDGVQLKGAGEFAAALYKAEAGSSVSLEVVRGGSRQNVTFVLP